MNFSGSFNLASGGLLWNEECRHLPFGGGFSSVKSSKILLCVSLEAEPGPCPKAALLFLGFSSFVSASPPFPDQQLLESALWNSGKVMEAGVCSLQTRNGRHRKVSVPRSPTGSCWVSMGLTQDPGWVSVGSRSARTLSAGNRSSESEK